MRSLALAVALIIAPNALALPEGGEATPPPAATAAPLEPAREAPPPETLPGVQAPKKTLLVLELEPIEVSPSTVRVINQLVTETYSRRPELHVVAASDLQKLLELEATKSSMGCDDATCLSEIAGAMGARYVVFGSVGRLGDLLVVTLNVFDAERAEAVQRHTIQVRDAERVPEELEVVVLGKERSAPSAPAASAVPAPEGAAQASDEPDEVPTLAFVGGGASALGALCLAGAGVGALLVDGTLGNPSAKPGDKSLALGAAPYLLGAAVGGSVLLVGGGVALGLGVLE